MTTSQAWEIVKPVMRVRQNDDAGLIMHAESRYAPDSIRAPNPASQTDLVSFRDIPLEPSKGFLGEYSLEAETEDEKKAFETLWRSSYPDVKYLHMEEAD